MTVRELLARWDARADGTTPYQRIDADLANHGLTTSPPYRKVSLDTSIRLITPSQDAASTGHAPADADGENELDVGLTVGNLPSALSGVVWIPPTATFDQAITMMMLNGYSQLAVLSGSHTVRGAVTWQSIAYARHANPDAGFADAIIPAREARYDQELVEVLPDLETWDFILHQRRRGLQPLVVLALAQQPGEQVPHAGGSGPQPVPLVVVAQQHLRHGQAGQLGVGHLRRLSRPGPGAAPRGDDAVGQLHVECGQKSVQVGDHDGFPRSDVCEHADLGHSSPRQSRINDGVS
jgi:hypothetical protein